MSVCWHLIHGHLDILTHLFRGTFSASDCLQMKGDYNGDGDFSVIKPLAINNDHFVQTRVIDLNSFQLILSRQKKELTIIFLVPWYGEKKGAPTCYLAQQSGVYLNLSWPKSR